MQSLYKSLDVLYLTDESDTMLAYEERGREKSPNISAYESGMQAFQKMDRIPQVEVMHGKPIGDHFFLTKRLKKLSHLLRETSVMYDQHLSITVVFV